MTYKKDDLSGRSTRSLKQRRRRLLGRLPEVSEVLRGALTEQGRRCGKPSCRCTRGELHGPYTYLSVAGPAGRSRMVYVPAELAEVVARRVAANEQMEAVLAEISAINLELLARRALD
jgi:transposase